MKSSTPLRSIALISFAILGASPIAMKETLLAQEQYTPTFNKQDASALIAGLHGAVAYSGFRSGQHPDRGEGANNPTADQVLEDLKLLSDTGQFPLIRLYDSQENSELVLRQIKDHKLSIKVMLGAWLDAELSNHEGCAWLTEPIPEEELVDNRIANEAEVRRTIQLAQAYSDIVVAVNVGNEALIDWNDHLVSIESMAAYITLVKEAIEQPVSTADNYVAWINHAEQLSKVVDFAGVHTYPIWEYKTIEEGLPYTIENMVAVQQALPGIPLSIMEAGWATTASEFPEQANETNQHTHFNELMAWTKEMNITTFWFEAFDEDWKGNPNDPNGAEKHWGLYTVDRKPKVTMQ